VYNDNRDGGERAYRRRREPHQGKQPNKSVTHGNVGSRELGCAVMVAPNIDRHA
jgi:hypothetical protein